MNARCANGKRLRTFALPRGVTCLCLDLVPWGLTDGARLSPSRDQNGAQMLGPILDVFRMRQYFDVIVRTREFIEGVRDDAGFLNDIRRAVIPLPIDSWPDPSSPFAPNELRNVTVAETQPRVALCATGGSGALASVVGVARAFEERETSPALISLCSGSALFGFPIAAGLSADTVAAFALALRPRDYVDIDWRRLALLAPTLARGFTGIIRGDKLEATYHELLGDMTLGEMPIPAYAPIWNIEDNRVEYLGLATYPDVSVARAARMAVSLPLFLEPAQLQGRAWCDGGIVDIFPVIPALDLGRRCDAAVAVNGFYPPEFAGENTTGWEQRLASIITVASQVRTCQQVELARVNLHRLRTAMPVVMIEPVRYEKVRGLGFYREFLNNRDWPHFMNAGHVAGSQALHELERITTDRSRHSDDQATHPCRPTVASPSPRP
jgi:NTE family protein